MDLSSSQIDNQNNNNNNSKSDCTHDANLTQNPDSDEQNNNATELFDIDSSDLEYDCSGSDQDESDKKSKSVEEIERRTLSHEEMSISTIPNERHSNEKLTDIQLEQTNSKQNSSKQANNCLVQEEKEEEEEEEEKDNVATIDDNAVEEEPIFDFLGKANEIAEARLAQRRLARAEARDIRMRELERQQKEQEQNADRAFDMQTAGLDPTTRSSRFAMSSGALGALRSGAMSSRRSSEDSLEEEGRSLRDIKQEIKDMEERYRKAMIANAQLDNERASNTYQIQLLKDKVEEMEEIHAQLHREHKEKCRQFDTLKRTNEKLMEDLRLVQGQLNERDTLIANEGMTIVSIENEDGSDARRALVSAENAQLLDTHQGSLDVRLKKFTEEKQALRTEIEQLHQQLIAAKTQRRSGSQNGPVDDEDYEDAQREANKLISDYKYKLTKSEQEIASLQASLARSETQVIRYKSTADAAEKVEAELKIERRKLQRENREMMEKLEELETSHNHLLKRLDKLKNAKSTLLKEL